MMMMMMILRVDDSRAFMPQVSGSASSQSKFMAVYADG